MAERWRKARASDTQPLLYLMESAEKRNAYKKSLRYLEEAEELDSLNPAVRRAKLRLLLSVTIRHLHERKTHLVAAEIEQLQTVPEVRPGEVAALAAGFHWCCAAIAHDHTAMQKQEEELMRSMGNVAGHLLIAALVRAANMGPKIFAPPLKVAGIPATELLSGTARACAVGEWGECFHSAAFWLDRETDRRVEEAQVPAGRRSVVSPWGGRSERLCQRTRLCRISGGTGR